MIRRCFWIFLLATFAVQAFAQDDTVVIRPVRDSGCSCESRHGDYNIPAIQWGCDQSEIYLVGTRPGDTAATGVDQAGFS